MRRLQDTYAAYQDADYNTILCKEEKGHQGVPNPIRFRLYRVTSVYESPDEHLVPPVRVDTEV